MKTSCIRHPAQHNKIVISQWQLDYCDGDHATAALLSHFEYWHNHKLRAIEAQENLRAYQEKNGQKGYLPELTLYQFNTEQELIKSILKACKSPTTIRKGLRFLEDKGAISIHRNPNNAFDRTRFFLFHPDVINAWLDEHYPPEPPATPKSTPAQRQGAMNNHTPYEPQAVDTTRVTETSNTEKTCSKCSSPMTQRKNKAGQEFWGCTQYPKCDHTESIQLKAKPPPKPPPKSISRRAVTLYDSRGQPLHAAYMTEDEINQLVPHHGDKGQVLGYLSSG